MNKHIETTLPTGTDNQASEATLEMLETVALEGVTGGCAACGNSACGTPGSQQPASSFRRR